MQPFVEYTCPSFHDLVSVSELLDGRFLMSVSYLSSA